MLESLEKMLAKGMDNPMLRFGLGKGYLDAGDAAQAATHLQRCVEQDPNYSAAWKPLTSISKLPLRAKASSSNASTCSRSLPGRRL